MSDLKERLDLLRKEIQKEDFLQGKGLSNEVNIRIFCYDAEDEMTVNHFIEQLRTDQSLSCRLIERNLYKVFLSICEDLDILDAIPDMEESEGGVFLLEQLHSAIREGDFLMKMQYGDHMRGDILLITGVGDVFPFMRVHKLLDALQPIFSDVPVLVMYPGDFDGHYLRLFDLLKPNDYYRAFNILRG